MIHIMSAIRAGTSLCGRWTWWGLTRECAFWRARNIKNGGSTTKHRSLGLCRHLHQRIEEHKGSAIECQTSPQRTTRKESKGHHKEL